ncbi:succinate-semialdehyde dehydrogenase [Malonomonas rubra DSM 5091]|uniref:Succinate-semialdehyde dehydrogenase n=1 Tax=Malonomonas rubra DSM 5091 TaxID=1122189 RepID=A0A1M6JDA9_MALRU|nr:aldehyde dehydrogenase family protein [Malonomonas rubra]SHJ44697.1 succinate-semialdehyde dehydrogenase [Malonomonas rubra DSM 5091]
MAAPTQIEKMMKKARIAQRSFESFDQAGVDAIVKVIAKVVYDHAHELAYEAVVETGMGVYEDKVAKCLGKSKVIWNHLKDKKSVGVIGRDLTSGIVYVAKPKGVVGAIMPTTNPVVTLMCNAMYALKGRNSIIIAPHPRAKKITGKTARLMQQKLDKLGAPANLLQYIKEPSLALTQELMKTVDVLVATGGPEMVKAAYSSGKPSYGVGPGNVQVLLDRDIDYNDAAQKVIYGRKFDNGIICSGEQTIIAPKEKYTEVIEAFTANGAFYIEEQATVDKFRQALFEEGHLSLNAVGQSVARIAELAGVEVPEEAKVILLRSNDRDDDILRKEKMFPVITTFQYDSFSEALAIAKKNLTIEGAGHSAAIHSNNDEHIESAGIELPISRLVVNEPSSTTAGGSLYNGFAPTTTLGCGSWGNNSISENLDYKHLINVSQVGYPQRDKLIPSDDEIWA